MDAQQLYRSINDEGKTLREMLKSKPSNSKEALEIRKSMITKSTMLVNTDAQYACNKEIEQLLWKPCFYKRIEDYRRRIRKYAAASSGDQAVRDHFHRVTIDFHNFLDESADFYEFLLKVFGNLISKIQQHRNRRLPIYSENFDAMDDADDIEQSQKKKCSQSCFRCLIFLGDLARYRELHSRKSKKDFSTAEKYYHRSITLNPENGNPHNQLAVLATYSEAECVAVYRYCRSLLVASPFWTSEENLVLLFEKNRQRKPPVIDFLSDQQRLLTKTLNPREKSSLLKMFLQQFVGLHGVLFSQLKNLEKSPKDPAANGNRNTSNLNDKYSSSVQNILCKELQQLLSISAIGDALYLKVIVICIFLIVRSNSTEFFELLSQKSSSPYVFNKKHCSSTDVDVLSIHYHSVILTFDIINQVLEFLCSSEVSFDISRSTQSSNPVRLLGPIAVFCDFLYLYPQILETKEVATLDFKSAVGDNLQSSRDSFIEISRWKESIQVLFFQKMSVLLTKLNQAVFDIGNVYESQDKWETIQSSLKERIELIGFSPFLAKKGRDHCVVGNGNSNSAAYGLVTSPLPENVAMVVRLRKLLYIGKTMTNPKTNDLCFTFRNDQFEYSSTNTLSRDSFDIENEESSISDLTPSSKEFKLHPMSNVNLSESNDSGHEIPEEMNVVNDDDDMDDEVIVFQPSKDQRIQEANGQYSNNETNTSLSTPTFYDRELPSIPGVLFDSPKSSSISVSSPFFHYEDPTDIAMPDSSNHRLMNDYSMFRSGVKNNKRTSLESGSHSSFGFGGAEFGWNDGEVQSLLSSNIPHRNPDDGAASASKLSASNAINKTTSKVEKKDNADSFFGDVPYFDSSLSELEAIESESARYGKEESSLSMFFQQSPAHNSVADFNSKNNISSSFSTSTLCSNSMNMQMSAPPPGFEIKGDNSSEGDSIYTKNPFIVGN